MTRLARLPATFDVDVRKVPEGAVTVSLSDDLRRELAQLAREAQTTEDELVLKAVKSLVQAHRAPAVPRFARRLGPLAVEED